MKRAEVRGQGAEISRGQRSEVRGQKPEPLGLTSDFCPLTSASCPAFTLIELLVVIAIIGLLTGLVVGLMPRADAARVRARVKTELVQLETAIEHYKEKRGHYPPDNPANSGSPSLYYELVGTVFDGNQTFTTLTGGDSIKKPAMLTAFGASGFVNANSPSVANGADDAKNFFPTVKANQASEDPAGVKFLGISTKGPTGAFCPWYYNSSTPTNNPNSYDLWVYVLVGGKTNIFGNWKHD